MKILTNDNNEYFGLVTDYKNLEVFRRAVMEESSYSDRVVIEKMIEMRPLTDHELSEEGDFSTYEPGHWIPVDASCETSKYFYFATQGVENEKVQAEEAQVSDGLLIAGDVAKELRKNYPHLTEEQIEEAVHNAELLGKSSDAESFSVEYSQERTEEIKEEE